MYMCHVLSKLRNVCSLFLFVHGLFLSRDVNGTIYPEFVLVYILVYIVKKHGVYILQGFLKTMILNEINFRFI